MPFPHLRTRHPEPQLPLTRQRIHPLRGKGPRAIPRRVEPTAPQSSLDRLNRRLVFRAKERTPLRFRAPGHDFRVKDIYPGAAGEDHGEGEERVCVDGEVDVGVTPGLRQLGDSGGGGVAGEEEGGGEDGDGWDGEGEGQVEVVC